MNATDASLSTASASDKLSKSLLARHLVMISIGGIIGAGLFVGSSAAIATIGPAVVLSYLFAGIVVYAVIRILARMAMDQPGLGSFTEYVRAALGRWRGLHHRLAVLVVLGGGGRHRGHRRRRDRPRLAAHVRDLADRPRR